MADRPAPNAHEAGARLAGKCGAKSRRTGLPCRNAMGWRTDHPGSGKCIYHGGASPAGKAAAKKEQAEAAAAKLGVPVETDPITALEDELKRCAGRVAFYDQVIAATELDELPAEWLKAQAVERDRLTRVATAMVQLGLEERRVRMVEQAGEFLARVIGGVLEDLGLREDPHAQAVVRRHLLVLEPGTANGNGGPAR